MVVSWYMMDSGFLCSVNQFSLPVLDCGFNVINPHIVSILIDIIQADPRKLLLFQFTL